MIDDDRLSDLVIAKVRAIDGLPDDSVHKAVRRQKSLLPAIAVTQVTGLATRAIGGEVISGNAQFRIDVYAETASDLGPVVRALKNGLDGYKGFLVPECFIHLATVTGPSDFSDDDGDLKLRHQLLDLELIYSEE